MQNSVPKGQGGMVAVLGSTVDEIERILMENKENLIDSGADIVVNTITDLNNDVFCDFYL